jgi:hypothetical protein
MLYIKFYHAAHSQVAPLKAQYTYTKIFSKTLSNALPIFKGNFIINPSRATWPGKKRTTENEQNAIYTMTFHVIMPVIARLPDSNLTKYIQKILSIFFIMRIS